MKTGDKVRTTVGLVIVGHGGEIPAGEIFTVSRQFDTNDGPRVSIWNDRRLLPQVRLEHLELVK